MPEKKKEEKDRMTKKVTCLLSKKSLKNKIIEGYFCETKKGIFFIPKTSILAYLVKK
ncbi:MAG: hypothetical protein IMZ53_08325 [Thermoplasmata archaeon]|nr:hypothetical protein [Thermoplasmata archaeon]MBE3140574.1 hypothetical protein [Thermoplasmata archaeon]